MCKAIQGQDVWKQLHNKAPGFAAITCCICDDGLDLGLEVSLNLFNLLQHVVSEYLSKVALCCCVQRLMRQCLHNNIMSALKPMALMHRARAAACQYCTA